MTLFVAYALNIIDYLFTSHWVNLYGINIEGNPLGRWMYENDIAGIVKIFIVGGLLAVMGYFINRYPKYAYTAYIPLVVYGLIDIYHLIILIIIKFII